MGSGESAWTLDFTDLNKACLKGPFPMPQIDQLMDATIGHPRMSFLDAFQGYHQMPLTLSDQEKTAFVTPIGNYHYKMMPFGLKNVGSTYQRMMTRMFKPQLGKSIEVYINDMVVKSKVVSEHVRDLRVIFDILSCATGDAGCRTAPKTNSTFAACAPECRCSLRPPTVPASRGTANPPR